MVQDWFDGPLALSGAIATGRSLLAAQVMGADFGYIGSAFIATREANASAAYKDCIVTSAAGDTVGRRYIKADLDAARYRARLTGLGTRWLDDSPR